MPRRPAETPRRSQASTFAHGESVLRLAYSPDGATLASAGADRVIKVWDAATLREKQAFEPQPDWVMGLALSADGKWLAAGRYDGTLGLYALARRRRRENSSSCRLGRQERSDRSMATTRLHSAFIAPGGIALAAAASPPVGPDRAADAAEA